jgi:spoIIIJ-associated protein
MSELKQYSGKTVNECLEKASSELNVKIEKIEYKVVQEPKTGILGIGKKDAIIEVTAVSEDVISTDNTNSTSSTESVSELKAEPVEVTEKTESVESEASADVEITDEIKEKVESVKTYLLNVIRNMGIDEIEIEAKVTASGADFLLNCKAENKGNLIGKRGETLDALQYLSSVMANRGSEDYFRITLDSNGYREKRNETLQQLALKIAKTVYKTGRSKSLEPMNPYERRIIHSVIADFKGVSSHSVGDEPYRKVVITCDNPKNSRNNYRKNGGYKGSNRNGRRSNSRYRSDKDYVPKPKNMDSMKTSFEKEYSKPKPEDSISGSLYGKIEL